MDFQQVFEVPLELESGVLLPKLEMRYTIYGDLSSGKPIVWICHALTADSKAADWWPGVVGENGFFSPSDYTILCANNLGSCYGSTGPESINPATRRVYWDDFPAITTRDMSLALIRLADALGIKQIDYLVGGSMGGQIALEWAIQQPWRMAHLVVLATNARHSPWGIAFNETQRMALSTDPEFGAGGAARSGLKAARAIALLSYRGYQTYAETQEDADSAVEIRRAASYQQYQGEKLANRFSAYAYWTLSKAMDAHDVGRNRGGTSRALAEIQAKTLIIGIRQDVLFPLSEQSFLAKSIRGARFRILESIYGHDGFLTESEAITGLLAEYVSQKEGIR
ncbi:MAG: homoserine O-acetyltransferase [Bacteroidota bacterium]|nr:homoserine O-acetyltransferase [Bacteroidota bacterium]MDX5429948.1 homoserine O-acetyltransferase [Bacteroidota bacterium]MDX5468721.1 homoserine O-acetyltransferase [Bacteroidota bacterium]